MMRLILKLRKCVTCAVVFSLATVDLSGKGAVADEITKQSDSSIIECPCIYDEPFATVINQIKSNLDGWQLSPLELHRENIAGSWNSYEIYKLNIKRHTLQLKLTKQTDSTIMFCSWIQWSNDGSIYNEIGMGHHLYMSLLEAEKAQNNCIAQLSSRLPVYTWHEHGQQKMLKTNTVGL